MRFTVPAAIFAAVATVIVELPDPLIDAGLNDAVAPEGRPLALRFTMPLKPLTAEVVTV